MDKFLTTSEVTATSCLELQKKTDFWLKYFNTATPYNMAVIISFTNNLWKNSETMSA